MSRTNLGIQVSDDGIGHSRKFCRAVCQRIEQGRPIPFDVLWLNHIVMRRPCREWRRHLALGYHTVAIENYASTYKVLLRLTRYNHKVIFFWRVGENFFILLHGIW